LRAGWPDTAPRTGHAKRKRDRPAAGLGPFVAQGLLGLILARNPSSERKLARSSPALFGLILAWRAASRLVS